jgi:hypothetical protein
LVEVRVAVKRVFSISALIILVWLSLMVGFFVVLKLMFELTLPWQKAAPTILDVTRIAASAFIALAWLFLWKRIVQGYLWRSLRTRHPS